MRAKTQLAVRQEDVGEGKQRLIGDEKGIAILSLSKTKREVEKVQEQPKAWQQYHCLLPQDTKSEAHWKQQQTRVLSAHRLAPYQGTVPSVYKALTFERSLCTTSSPTSAEILKEFREADL